MARYKRRHASAPMPRNGGTMHSSRTVYETFYDIMANSKMPATLINGVFTAASGQANFKAQVDAGGDAIAANQPQMNMAAMDLTMGNMMTDPDMMMMPNPSMMFPPPSMYPTPPPPVQDHEMMLRNNLIQPQPMPPQNPMAVAYGGAINSAKFMIYGAKSRPSNNLCYCLTYILGSILIFPLFFVCCMWWKGIVYPTYELTADAYHAVARFIAKTPTLSTLDLTVVDNAFNAQKAAILHQALSKSQIQSFLFTNWALNSNGRDNEASNFRQNMSAIKALSMKTSIVWADMEF